MAIEMKLDRIEGSSYSASMLNGEKLIRVGFINGLGEVPPDSVHQRAKAHAESKVGKIGTENSKHPKSPHLIVQNIDIQPTGFDTAMAFIHYGRRSITTMEVSGALSQENVFRDADGANIELRYTPGHEAALRYSLEAGKEIPVTGSVSKLIPGATVRFKTSAVTSPLNMISTWLGRTNDGDIVFKDGDNGSIITESNLWLCTSVQGRQDDPNILNGWTRVIDFVYNPDTWFGVQFYQIDGTPPLDVANIDGKTVGVFNGVTVIKLYGEKEFSIPAFDDVDVVIDGDTGGETQVA